LSNTGGAALNWTASKTSAWLDLSVPTSGTLAPGASVPVGVSINANANALAAGIYTDTVTFTNATAAVSETRGVQLTVVAVSPDLTLKGYWKLDDGSGTTASDSSGNANHGTLLPAPPNGPVWTTGHLNGALEFDGTNDYVNVGTSDFGATSEITIAFWVYATGSGTGYQTLIARNLSVHSFAVELSKTTAKFRTVIRTAAGTNYLNSNAVLPPDSWHHFALTYRSGERVVYVDSVRDNSNALTGDLRPYASDTTTLGTNGVGQFFRGRLDDVRIYSRALTAQEVEALFGGAAFAGSATVASAQQQAGNGEGELASAKAKPDTPAKEMRLVVEHLYLNILAREPGADEIAEWAGRISRSLEQGIHVRLAMREMTQTLFGSKEYTDRGRSDEQFLMDCYRTFALRDPNVEELAAWDAPFRDRSAVINTLMESPAFTRMLSVLFPNSEGGTTESCVAALYLDILRRLPTPEELASGCSSLEVSQDKKQALQKLIERLSAPQHTPIEDLPMGNRASIRDGSQPILESCREWTNAYLIRE
jgi:hypothetical protein